VQSAASQKSHVIQTANPAQKPSVKILMMPNVAGTRSTRNRIFIFALILVPVTLLPWLSGVSRIFFGVTAGVRWAIFIRSSWNVFTTPPQDTSFTSERHSFRGPVLYRMLIFSPLPVDSVVGNFVLVRSA